MRFAFPVWLALAGLLSFLQLRDPGFGPQGDVLHHYYLVRAYAQSLTEGVWWPRWAGMLDGGRGDAVFTFYSPLFYFIAGLITWVFSLDPLLTIKMLIFGIVLLSQISMYFLAREFFPAAISLYVSSTFVLMPGFTHILFQRQFLPQMCAVALSPFALLLTLHIINGTRSTMRYAVPFLGALCAGVCLLHSASALMLSFCVTALVIVRHKRISLAAYRSLALAAFCAAGLAAFALLPQLQEFPLVQIDREIAHHRIQDYFLFAPPADDTPYRVLWAKLNLGISIFTLTQIFLGFALAYITRGQRDFVFYFSIFLLGFSSLISLPLSLPFWRYFPGVNYLQFPWRFAPFTGIAIALLFGRAVAERFWVKEKTMTIIVSGLIALSLMSALRMTFPSPTHFSAAEVQQRIAGSGLQPINQKEARQLRNHDRVTFMSYSANRLPFRPRGSDELLYPPVQKPGGFRVLSGDAKIETQNLFSQERRATVVAVTSAQIELNTYDYPHWEIMTNGSTVIRHDASSSEGLLRFSLSPGRHEIQIRYTTDQFAYYVGICISAMTALLMVGYLQIQMKSDFVDVHVLRNTST